MQDAAAQRRTVAAGRRGRRAHDRRAPAGRWRAAGGALRPAAGSRALARRRGCAVRHRGGQGRRGLRREARLARRDRDRARDAPARCPAALAHRRPAPRRRRVRTRRDARARCPRHRRRSSCSRPTSWRSPTTRSQPRPTGGERDLAGAATRAGAAVEPISEADWMRALRRACLRHVYGWQDATRASRCPVSTRPGRTTRAGASRSFRTRPPRRIAPTQSVPPPPAALVERVREATRAVSRLDLDPAASAHLDELTGSCVSCGLCLPACPTFQLTREESESPRGRIELVAALQAGELTVEDVRPHLDRCLGCRACEPVCPSDVRYGEILELARDGGAVTRTRTVDATLAAVRRPGLIGALVRAGRPFATLTPGPLGAMGRATDRPRRVVWERRRPGAPRAAVLRGCVMQHAFAPAQQAAVDPPCGLRLRRRRGARPGLLRRPAPAQRRAAEGERMRVETLAAFRGRHADRVDLGGLRGGVARARSRSRASTSRRRSPAHRSLPRSRSDRCGSPSSIRAICATHRASWTSRDDSRPRLRARCVELRDAGRCCGAAGVYALEQPELSTQLRDDRVAAIRESGAEVVALRQSRVRAPAAAGARRGGSVEGARRASRRARGRGYVTRPATHRNVVCMTIRPVAPSSNSASVSRRTARTASAPASAAARAPPAEHRSPRTASSMLA